MDLLGSKAVTDLLNEGKLPPVELEVKTNTIIILAVAVVIVAVIIILISKIVK